MRPRSVASEAARNLRSGTTRALLLAVAFVLLVGTLAALDTRAVVDVLRGAADFRASGAAIATLAAPGRVDGGRCEAFSDVPGITAGAYRAGEPLRALSLPSSRLSVFDVTPGLLDVLTGTTTPARTSGVWLSAGLAETLGVVAGDRLATSSGDATVAGIYAYPDDGRDRALAYAVLTPVPPAGTFDVCWAEAWPVDAGSSALLPTALLPGTDPTEATLGQLNTRLGAEHDALDLLAHRLTRHAPVAALLTGFVLGAASVRARRLELAAALHARVPRPALAWQVLLEVLAWTLAGALIAGACLLWISRWGNPDPGAEAWWTGLRVVAVGAGGALLGALLGVLGTRERSLFRYFKDR
ncbi:hypothetical protein M3693_01045 [Cellulosimicrobium funkei]|uniref:hypothetical protein n=1 Tax=Cellulosimicrobium funkei TaxID=264251 RepID=UPI00203B02C9|nr:hypothetical protein [Cellulosimicrobium funkei]MCM3532814.1 hypothetical protein [Cellulosimicrobium funkei]